MNFQNPDITTAKELMPDDALIKIYNKKIGIQQTERIYLPYRTLAKDRNPIIIIGDIESDLNIFKRIQEICKKMKKKNLFDPKFCKDVYSGITFVILGDIVGKFGRSDWNKYIFALFVLAELAHPLSVYLLRGCEEEQFFKTKYENLKNDIDLAMKRSCAKMPYAIFDRGSRRNIHPILFIHGGIVDGLLKSENLNDEELKILIGRQDENESIIESTLIDKDILKNEKIRLLVTAHELKNVNFNILTQMPVYFI